MMTELEQYYNKFNEEKRLDSRHGKVEFITSMKYIHEYLGGHDKETLRHRCRNRKIFGGTGRRRLRCQRC